MEEVTISTKALVHLIGLIIGLMLTIAVQFSAPDKKGLTLMFGWLFLLLYFLVMPESYLHELLSKR